MILHSFVAIAVLPNNHLCISSASVGVKHTSTVALAKQTHVVCNGSGLEDVALATVALTEIARVLTAVGLT